jgi:hypothetical protein
MQLYAASLDVGQLLTLLLGGGAVATLTALFSGIKSLREGSKARERDTIKDLIDQRNEAWDMRDNALDARDYWRNWAGQLEYLARSQGLVIPTRPVLPGEANEQDRN